MENLIIHAPLKQVGNSLCVFIPAEIKEKLGLKQKDEVTIQINKRKNKKALLSLAGATKGKLGPWTEEDRLDVRE